MVVPPAWPESSLVLAGAANEMAWMSRHIRSPLVLVLRLMAKFAIRCQLGEGRNGFSDRSPRECSEEAVMYATSCGEILTEISFGG